jgi:hypothetical protein
MTLLPLIVGLLGGGLALSLGIHAVTLWKMAHTPDLSELDAEVTSLRLQVTDLIDRVDSWQRRDKTRNAREVRAQKDQEPLEEAPGGDRKAALRRKVFGKLNVMAE